MNIRHHALEYTIFKIMEFFFVILPKENHDKTSIINIEIIPWLYKFSTTSHVPHPDGNHSKINFIIIWCLFHQLWLVVVFCLGFWLNVSIILIWSNHACHYYKPSPLIMKFSAFCYIGFMKEITNIRLCLVCIHHEYCIPVHPSHVCCITSSFDC